MPQFGSIHVSPSEVIGVVDRIYSSDRMKQLKNAGLKILEFRFDSFKENWPDVIAFLRENRAEFSILGTMRETGQSRDVLIQSYEGFVELVDCIDIELATAEHLKMDLISVVRAGRRQLMISHHDFQKMPDIEEIQMMINAAQRLQPDFIKLALFAKNPEESLALMRFIAGYHRRNEEPELTAFAMGETGALTRVFGRFLGSLFTYGYIESPNAPGQLSVDELLRFNRSVEGF